MLSESKPMFRKVIYPFYESETACIAIIAVTLILIIFSAAGISVAREESKYNDYVWVPVTLLIMSAAILVPAAIRLIKQYIVRSSNKIIN
jgi:hypothetical protein